MKDLERNGTEWKIKYLKILSQTNKISFLSIFREGGSHVCMCICITSLVHIEKEKESLKTKKNFYNLTFLPV